MPPRLAEKSRITVWDLPTRVFHWSLALSFAGAFLTAESEPYRGVHVMLGYTLLGLIAFRLVWGFVGSRYARFSEFAAGPGRVLGYLKSLLAGRPARYLGHNPAGAVAIFALLGLGLATALSGLATYQELGGDWLEEVHEGLANAMLGLVVIHVLGVLVSSRLHRENLVGAMITGMKAGDPAAAIGRRHGIIAVLLAAAVIGFWAVDRLGAADAPATAPSHEHQRHGD